MSTANPTGSPTGVLQAADALQDILEILAEDYGQTDLLTQAQQLLRFIQAGVRVERE
jgi:hypothetical protein